MHRRLRANRKLIPPEFVLVHEVDERKVEAIVAHLRMGGSIPPIVVVDYGSWVMPIDGHHRLYAAQRLSLAVDAWVVKAAAFERLDCDCRNDGDGLNRAEDFVYCGGVPAKAVARAWHDRS